MSDEIDLDELSRYIDHLQRQLVTAGTDVWFDHEQFRESINLRKATLGDGLPAEVRAELVEEYVRAINAFKPSGPYDSASAAAIFHPLMDGIVGAANAAGFRTSRVIRLVTSPAIEPTPYTRSTDAAHLIFVGPATFMFCNYWAKVFTSLTTGRPVAQRGRGSLPLTVEAIAGASKLGAYYAMTGTVMGIGAMPSSPNAIAFRGEYVEAMELFALGHEFGHCVTHDADERYRGILSEETQHELELLCDRIGTATSRGASAPDSWVGFCGAGAVLFLYAHELCQRARALTTAINSDMHHYPSTKARVAGIRDQVVSTTPDDQLEGVTAYIDDVIVLCEELTDASSEILADVLPHR